METIKSYTDIFQSKKLAEILPIESADMYYQYVLPKSSKIKHNPEIGNPINSLKWYNEGYTFRGRRKPITLNDYCIPCWSLAALLKLIPNFNMFKRTIECKMETTNHSIDKACDLVDAAFEMVCWLKENNKI